MFGIQINFKDGIQDWVDPCELEPKVIADKLKVSNIYHSYLYDLSDIDNWHKYELCGECGHDLRTFDCTDSECEGPEPIKINKPQ